jgi:hypothetical protein
MQALEVQEGVLVSVTHQPGGLVLVARLDKAMLGDHPVQAKMMQPPVAVVVLEGQVTTLLVLAY